ncbi:hypothetical protein FRC00_004722 [Tulasnella sp. 408]|nr:hypothetical protein FRC00_004722 [Tulasnella sp. 408]
MELSGYRPTARFIRDDSEVKIVDDFGNEVARGRIDGKRLVSFEGTQISEKAPKNIEKAPDKKLETIAEGPPTDESDTESDVYPRSPVDDSRGVKLTDARHNVSTTDAFTHFRFHVSDMGLM